MDYNWAEQEFDILRDKLKRVAVLIVDNHLVEAALIIGCLHYEVLFALSMMKREAKNEEASPKQ